MRTAIAILFVGAALPLWAAPKPTGLTDEQLVEKAKKLNTDTRTLEDADAQLKELLKDKANAAKLVRVAGKMQKAAKEGEKPFRYFAALVLAKIGHATKEYDGAEQFYEVATDIAINDLQSTDHIVRAADGHLDLLFLRKKYDPLLELCDKLEQFNGDNAYKSFVFLDVFDKRLLAYSRKGDFEKASDMVDKLIKSFDGNYLFIQMKARLYRDAEKYDDAIKIYEQVIDAINENDNLKKDEKERYGRGVKYFISGIHVETNKIDKGIELLRELVKADPDNATFKNDLGFILCDNDKSMDEAEKLIREAIEQDLKVRRKLADEGKMDKADAAKANPAYIDSLGWVLFKQKKYDEALKYLLESAGSDDDEGQSIEIWDHVADCYAAMGKKKEAVETYQKALKMEDTNKKDGERRKKVTEKLKKLKAEIM